MKNSLLKETNLKFAMVVNLVDSSTVLGTSIKESTNFGQFEGIEIAEVQSTMSSKMVRLGHGGVFKDVKTQRTVVKSHALQE